MPEEKQNETPIAEYARRCLCWRDRRNPFSVESGRFDDPDDIAEPRGKDCYCDNCHYGKDTLAVEILNLLGEIGRSKRARIDGNWQYKAIVFNADGTIASRTEFSDWFPDDEAAKAGFVEIMRSQGYAVASVEIGFPCVVTLE